MISLKFKLRYYKMKGLRYIRGRYRQFVAWAKGEGKDDPIFPQAPREKVSPDKLKSTGAVFVASSAIGINNVMKAALKLGKTLGRGKVLLVGSIFGAMASAVWWHVPAAEDGVTEEDLFTVMNISKNAQFDPSDDFIKPVDIAHAIAIGHPYRGPSDEHYNSCDENGFINDDGDEDDDDWDDGEETGFEEDPNYDEEAGGFIKKPKSSGLSDHIFEPKQPKRKRTSLDDFEMSIKREEKESQEEPTRLKPGWLS